MAYATSIKILILFLSVSILVGCGDGDNTGSTRLPPGAAPPSPIDLEKFPPKESVNGLNIYYPDVFFQNQTASFAVTTTEATALKNIQWQQRSGPPLTFLAAHTQVIGFDVPEAGDYQLELLAITTSNQQINRTFSFRAKASDKDNTSIRLDHAAVEQAKVSLRVDTQNRATRSVRWEQLSGPAVNDIQTQDELIFFNAPNVEQDSIIQFQATVNFADGSSATDTSLVLVKDTAINPDGFFPGATDKVVTTDVFPYIKDGPYSDILVDCIYNNQLERSCSFQTLPLIGTEYTSPTIEQVLSRLVVSHQWLGNRFKQFLEESATSEDMLKLLRATTAIVISYDIRPSFYWTATGAIYLDAQNFWVEPEERDTLNEQPDFRSNFGRDLRFIIPWRYVKDNGYYFALSSDYPVEQRNSKGFNHFEADITWLMYHELAHANDFFPPSSWGQLDPTSSPLEHYNQTPAASDSFASTFPLISSDMHSLAQVSFLGAEATASQKSITAQEVESYFTPDSAPAYYSYSTIREDYATLFERFMMLYRLNVNADDAIISTENNEALNVTWGQRDRVNHPSLQLRVKEVVNNIFPELDVEAIQATLPSPILMTPNVDWFSNIQLSASDSNNASAKNILVRPQSIEDYWQSYKHGPDQLDLPNQ